MEENYCDILVDELESVDLLLKKLTEDSKKADDRDRSLYEGRIEEIGVLRRDLIKDLNSCRKGWHSSGKYY